MALFLIDTTGDANLLNKKCENTEPALEVSSLLEPAQQSGEKPGIALPLAFDEHKSDTEDDDEVDYFGLPPPSVDISKILQEKSMCLSRSHAPEADEKMAKATALVDAATQKAQTNKKQKFNSKKRLAELDYSNFNAETGKFAEELSMARANVDKQLQSTELGDNFEQLKQLPSITQKMQRKLGRLERAKTKGDKWFNMPATEMTPEIARDLKVLQMRSVLDPKHFYKKNDLKVLPKYFQIGVVQHSPLDYYKERDTRRNKKHGLVDEILADAKVQQYTKRKYNEICAVKQQKYAHRKKMLKMKKLKKNK